MFLLLISIIYVAFISLGLPDALLGSAWPLMVGEFDTVLANAGIVSMIIAACTIVSSLTSNWLTRKLGVGLVAAVSTLLTVAALVGFSLADALWVLCVLAVPYGLGAGAIDAALNNFVAVHYAAKHMNWLGVLVLRLAHILWGGPLEVAMVGVRAMVLLPSSRQCLQSP